MVLLKFVVVGALRSKKRPDQMTTVPIAGCWMDKETAERYEWAIQSFKDIVRPTGTDEKLLPRCFVTDDEEALLAAIKTVFPNSSQILCWIHIQRNFLLRFKKSLNPKLKANCKLQRQLH